MGVKKAQVFSIYLDGEKINPERNISINTLSFRNVVSENGR
jgi:hypothetical protein